MEDVGIGRVNLYEGCLVRSCSADRRSVIGICGKHSDLAACKACRLDSAVYSEDITLCCSPGCDELIADFVGIAAVGSRCNRKGAECGRDLTRGYEFAGSVCQFDVALNGDCSKAGSIGKGYLSGAPAIICIPVISVTAVDRKRSTCSGLSRRSIINSYIIRCVCAAQLDRNICRRPADRNSNCTSAAAYGVRSVHIDDRITGNDIRRSVMRSYVSAVRRDLARCHFSTVDFTFSSELSENNSLEKVSRSFRTGIFLPTCFECVFMSELRAEPLA